MNNEQWVCLIHDGAVAFRPMQITFHMEAGFIDLALPGNPQMTVILTLDQWAAINAHLGNTDRRDPKRGFDALREQFGDLVQYIPTDEEAAAAHAPDAVDMSGDAPDEADPYDEEKLRSFGWDVAKMHGGKWSWYTTDGQCVGPELQTRAAAVAHANKVIGHVLAVAQPQPVVPDAVVRDAEVVLFLARKAIEHRLSSWMHADDDVERFAKWLRSLPPTLQPQDDDA